MLFCLEKSEGIKISVSSLKVIERITISSHIPPVLLTTHKIILLSLRLHLIPVYLSLMSSLDRVRDRNDYRKLKRNCWSLKVSTSTRINIKFYFAYNVNNFVTLLISSENIVSL